jgi:UDP-N-acetyl-D-galactosamine dehydrogenase
LGLTFKENVPDIRNSRVPDILKELESFGIKPLTHDPLASPPELTHEYGLEIDPLTKFQELDALILAVPHRFYLERPAKMLAMLRDGGIFVDIKSAMDPAATPNNLRYWSL